MLVIRKVNGYELNVGDLMAQGLFNITNDETKEISLWFDSDTTDELLAMSDEEFEDEAKEMCKLGNI